MIPFINSNVGIAFIYWEAAVEIPEPVDVIGGGVGYVPPLDVRVRPEDDWLVIETALIEVTPSDGVKCKAKLIKRGVAVRLVKPT